MAKTFRLDGEISDIDIRSEVFGNWISDRTLKAWLDTLTEGEYAEIEINSCGGDCIVGLAMANAIKNSKARIAAHVIGIAASMASVVACACDQIIIDESAFLMIHDPWVDMQGTANDLRKQADVMDQFKRACIAFYLSKFDGDENKLAELMTAETWWTGAEARDAGILCDVIASDVRISACVNRFDHVPEGAAQFIRSDIDKTVRASIDGLARKQAELDRAKAEIESTVTKRISAAMKSRDEEINALKAQLADKDGLIESAKAELTNLYTDQLTHKDEELESAKAELTSLYQKCENAETECADVRAQLELLNKAHAQLMGGVLTPPATPTRTLDSIANDTSMTPDEKSKMIARGDYVR